MSDVKKLSQAISGMPLMTSFGTNIGLMALVGGILQRIPSKYLQQFVMEPRQSGSAINLDADKVNGVFNLSSCTGTKPSTYGIVFQFGFGSDWYQFAVDSNSHFFTRANTNNHVGIWRRFTQDSTFVAPKSVGGG